MLEFVTFLLAPVGYAGLALAAVRAAQRHASAMLRGGVAAVVVVHVALVWVVRYDGQVSEATRNGYAGFVLFHAALAAIVASAFVAERIARPLVIGAFGIVTVGALGAVFRYDVVALYRIPVMLTAIGGGVGLLRARRARTS